MSRLKRFAHSLLSGYMQLVVNSIFILVSVRLALHYLSKDEYGLWTTVMVTASYIALMDLGFSGAAARILIDYKDHQKPEEYGGIILTSAWVGLAQAALILGVGTLLAFVLGPLLHNIPPELEREFFWLIVGQSAVTAGMFAIRIVSLILTANQRFDVVNYSSALALSLNLATLWWCFAHHDGIFSMLWGQAAAVVVTLAVNWIGCYTLRLFPRRGCWGRPEWKKFHELFAFGQDVFLFTVGNQFINLSQTLLLTRLIGLEAAATWGVCTRAYVVLVQIISRIFDYSSSALAEMMVRGERELLLRRFREICVLSVNLAVVAGVLFAVGNGPFVTAWTSGEIHWPVVNDVLLGIWLVVLITVRLHTGLVGQTKMYRFMRYLFFIEGIAFITMTVLVHRYGGITAMLVSSIVCSLCFTFSYGLWRTRKYFRISWRDLAAWHWSTLVLTGTVTPAALLVRWCCQNLPPLQRILLESGILGPWAAVMFLRYGLGDSLHTEVCRRAPKWAQQFFGRAKFVKSSA